MKKIKDNIKNTKIAITFPDKIQIDLVPANELKLYERFHWLVTLLLPISAGFITAFFVEPEQKWSLLWSGGVMAIVSAIFIFFAFSQRKKIFNGKIFREKSLDDFN